MSYYKVAILQYKRMSHYALFHADMIANPKRSKAPTKTETQTIEKEVHELAADIVAFYKPRTPEEKTKFLEHLHKAVQLALKEWKTMQSAT